VDAGSNLTGHSGSSLDIKKNFFFFFVLYVSLNLSDLTHRS
jgi:hypothetical protein